MSNYRRANTPVASYFFTVVTFRRRNILTDEDCRAGWRDAVLKTSQVERSIFSRSPKLNNNNK